MRALLVAAFALMTLACAPPATADAKPPGTSLSQPYKQVRDSVVVIETVQRDLRADTVGRMVAMGGLGSGVLISKDGLVVTAAHVVQVAEKIRVHFEGHEAIPAKVVRSVPSADVALLQLDWVPPEAVAAKVGNSDIMEVGDQVFVVGAPLGIDHTLTVGYLSARRQPEDMMAGFVAAELFQTDASINQGNSGGPMFNMRGEVVGIVSHIVSQTGGSEGLGFAVTSNATKQLLMKKGGIYSGLGGHLIDGKLAEALNVPQPRGYLVERVAKGSMGERLGLRPGSMKATILGQEVVIGGDIILEVMGVIIGTGDYREVQDRIWQAFAALKPGDAVTLKILRAGEVVTLRTPFAAEDGAPQGSAGAPPAASAK